MCGINLIVNKNSNSVVQSALEKANKALWHRGPDEQSVFAHQNIGLGFARLSIVDIAGGHQPFFNENKEIISVCNGEIYNYRDLRSQLIARGHTFQSQSDCEVLVHLYEDEGEDFVTRLEGMFAFILLDTKKNLLFLGRDRLGIKPLFLYNSGDRFAASSEIKSLFCLTETRPSLAPSAIYDSFTFGYIPGRQTAFTDIFHLPPASLGVFDLNTHSLTAKEYWAPGFLPGSEQGLLDGGRCVRQLRGALTEAVSSHTIGDVPMSAYLSGGIDSTTITTLLQKTLTDKRSLATFSIAFAEAGYDESGIFRETIKKMGLTSHELLMEKASGEDFGRTIHSLEQPQFSALDLPFWQLAKLVRNQQRKVVLVGEGSDELFGGYAFFTLNQVRRALSLPSTAAFKEIILPTAIEYFLGQNEFSKHVSECYRAESSEVIDRFGTYPAWYPFYLFTDAQKHTFFSKDLLAELPGSLAEGSAFWSIAQPLKDQFKEISDFDKSIFIELKTRLPNYILSRTDRNSMAHSVELRLPFLDNRVIDCCLKIPSLHKIRGLKEKWALRKAFDGILPKHVTNRRKFAYSAPSKWLWDNPDEYTQELLSEGALTKVGIFDSSNVRKMLQRITAATAEEKTSMSYDSDTRNLTGILSVQSLHNSYSAS